MAKVANPRKVFNYKVEINGIDQFTIQILKLPTQEVEVVEHGDTNFKVKTGGLVTTGPMEMTRLLPITDSDTVGQNWLLLVQDAFIGGGVLPSVYKQDMVIKELDSTGTTTVNRWIVEGAWPSKIEYSDLDRTKSENYTEKLTLQVDRCKRV